MNPSDTSDAHLDREAAAWLVRSDRGLTPAEQDAFSQWLASDPRCRIWYAQHQRTWREFNLVAQWRPEHSAEPNPDLLARPHRASRWLAWATPVALAASIALAFFIWTRSPDPTGEPFPVPATVARTRTLDDGSSVALRGVSEVVVAFTPAERRIELLRGEAFFTVSKDPDRPFVVHANGVEVRAVGTAFNVRVGAHAIEVLVTEGRVQLDPSTRTESDESSPAPRLVGAGERAVVAITATVAAPQVSAVTEADIVQELAWQPRLLDFNSTPLSEVVAEFNARNRTQLVLAEDSLASLPIVASIRSDNVEGFVRLLEANDSVRAERRGERILLRPARRP